MTRERKPWRYKGFDIYPHDFNSMGLRWYARSPWGLLRADTKDGMRELINNELQKQRQEI